MKIVFLGSGQFGIDSLNGLADSNHSLEFIFTQPAQSAGRGRKPKPTPVAVWAAEHGVPFAETENINTPEQLRKLAELDFDLLVVIAFGQKIGNELINLPPKGAINVHASVLPKYRGAAPINWAIINGEAETGISIITLAEKMDAGQILGQAKTAIGPNETAGQLHDRLAQIAAPLLVETVDRIADGTAVYDEQDDSRATVASKLKKSDGFLDFDESAETIRRKILGFWPWPGATANYISKETGKTIRVTVAAAEVVQECDSANLPAGSLDENLNVICGRGALKITELKPAGKKLIAFSDFVNGQHSRCGDLFARVGG